MDSTSQYDCFVVVDAILLGIKNHSDEEVRIARYK